MKNKFLLFMLIALLYTTNMIAGNISNTVVPTKHNETTKACNSCHKANGHPYINYQLPKKEPEYLRMSL